MTTFLYDIEDLENLNDFIGFTYPFDDPNEIVYLEDIKHKKYRNLNLSVVQEAQDSQINLALYNKLMGMSDEEAFDYYIRILKFLNYHPIIVLPKRTNGVDILLNEGDEKIAVRIRIKYNTKGMRAVQEVVSGAIMHGCHKVMIVGGLNRFAEKLARANDCCRILPSPSVYINSYGYDDMFYEIAEAYECSKQNTEPVYLAIPTEEARAKRQLQRQKRAIIKWHAFLRHAQKKKLGVVLRRNSEIVYKNDFADD